MIDVRKIKGRRRSKMVKIIVSKEWSDYKDNEKNKSFISDNLDHIKRVFKRRKLVYIQHVSHDIRGKIFSKLELSGYANLSYDYKTKTLSMNITLGSNKEFVSACEEAGKIFEQTLKIKVKLIT